MSMSCLNTIVVFKAQILAIMTCKVFAVTETPAYRVNPSTL